MMMSNMAATTALADSTRTVIGTAMRHSRGHRRYITRYSSFTSKNDNNHIDDIHNQGSSYTGQLTSNRKLLEILQHFPQDEIVYAFGYGSGVFSQQLVSTSNNNNDNNATTTFGKDESPTTTAPPPSPAGMLDLILVVRNAQTFHHMNMQQHPHHYAPWLRVFGGASTASWMQRHFPLSDAKVLFHVVHDNDDSSNNNNGVLPPMKYGIVQWDDLQRDLTQWSYLYLAGRLHKPTLPIVVPPPDGFVEAQSINLQAVVSAALLLLQSSTTMTTTDDQNKDDSQPTRDPMSGKNTNSVLLPWSTLFGQIASLSYTGDFRMQVGGEDPHKVSKLVHGPGQLERFQDLYRHEYSIFQPLEQMGLLTVVPSQGIEWDSSSVASRRELWKNLPQQLQQLQHQPKYPSRGRGGSTMTTTTSSSSSSSITQKDDVVDNDHTVQLLAQGLAAIVAPTARYQSFKGIFTLGARKSLRYAKAKLAKGGLFRTNSSRKGNTTILP
jgi:mitochondrial translocator assembly and maintenance protein 41